jgi:hypothetical protein
MVASPSSVLLTDRELFASSRSALSSTLPWSMSTFGVPSSPEKVPSGSITKDAVSKPLPIESQKTQNCNRCAATNL